MNFTQPPVDPNLADVLALFKRQIFLDMNCHALATIQAVDYDSKTISANINYTKTQLVRQPNGTSLQTQLNYPLLAEVPFIFMGSGSAGFTFPITIGSQCLIIFNDRDMDNWVSGARQGPVATPRLHSFSDAIALIGLDQISNYDPERVMMFNGEAMVGVGETLVKISNAAHSLGDILQQILTQLETLANTVAANGSPLNPTVATALSSLATQLGGLIE